MNFDGSISINELMICVGALAIVMLSLILWYRKDTASEERHKSYIDLSNICKEEGLSFTAELLKCAAVDDFSGMYKVVLDAKATMLNPETRAVHLLGMFKVQLTKDAYKDLILARAKEIEALLPEE